MSIGSLWSVKPEFRLKVSLLALTFAFLTATQAVWRSLKVSIFAKMVGAAYVPDAKIYSLILLIPLILFYSKLVDVLRRHQLMYVFTITHSLGGFLFAYLLAHPTLGIANTVPSKDRWVGWALYFFFESFSAFLSTSFWSFANSVNKPKDAKNFYGLFVAGSKVGGILAASSMWLFLMIGIGNLGWVTKFFTDNAVSFSDTTLITTLLATGASFLLGASICIYSLMKFVPGYHMHGYEAVYQVEKNRERAPEPFSLYRWLKQSIDGLLVIVSHPYVLGIFSLSLFYDTIMTIIDFYVMTAADEANGTVAKLTIYYAAYFLTMHVCGFFISFFVTTPLQRIFSNRTMLLMFPAFCMAAVIAVFFFPSAETLFLVAALLRGANYGLNHPIREMLYIPTTKEIKFKSKAWTDAFGTRIAKASGSLFYKNVSSYSPAFSHLVSNSFMLSITSVWLVVSYFLGRTLQKALDTQSVIGNESTLLDDKPEV
ncbi:MAG: carrier protein [Candidatus Dependentiae bacterium]|nr:carrier protein [Candidatus Dependentiae bacterium]